jgi:proline iminopeptidase
MPTFSAHDGTLLAYRVLGDGDPLVCLPGGPMQDSRYLGDLGGLSAQRRLIVLDLRGTGQSAIPADTSSYRCDRLVEDVEALREHLGLDRMDVLGHSAGTNLATLYATEHPKRVGKLVLVTPSLFGVGIAVSGEERREVAQLRKNEPWYPQASAALAAIAAGQATADDWEAITPFRYGRWDPAAQEHYAAGSQQTNEEAAEIFGSEGAFSPEAIRAALAGYQGPVLLLAGEVDLNSPPRAVTEYAGLFPAATLVVQPGAGHQPWLDDADRFAAGITAFLR